MFKHILKLMWNKKTNHIFFFIEILIIFFICTITTLFISDLLRMYWVDIGFKSDKQYVVRADFGSLKDSVHLVKTKENIMREIKQNPNIASATWMGSPYPFTGNSWGTGNSDLGYYFFAQFVQCDVGVIKTLEAQIIRGRSFEKNDYNNKYTPVIVNKMFYDNYSKSKGDILDSVIQFNGEKQIIGVVDHFKQNGEFTKEENYFIALNHSQSISDYKRIPSNLVVKTIPNPDPKFQLEINNIFTQQSEFNNVYISSFAKSRKDANAPYWAQLVLVGIISLFLLINISLGLIGILSHTVSKRKSEIGLRKALGATTNGIVIQFVSEVMLVAGLAILIGLIFVFQVPYLMEFEFDKMDLYKSAIISMSFILILLFLSSIIPSLKGASLQPASALHEE